MPPPDLLTVLRRATEADLLAVQERMKTLLDEVEELKAVEKVLSIKIHGKPQRKSPVRRQRAESPNGATGHADPPATQGSGPRRFHLKNRMLKVLLRRGATKPAILQTEANGESDDVKAVLEQHTDLFQVAPDGISLTGKGKAAAE